MCCTLSPAKLSDTLIYAGEGIHNDKEVHVLAYQNKATSIWGWDRLKNKHCPNAMVLPFPTVEEMGPENMIDTSTFKNFLKDISEASKHQMRTLGSRGDMTKGFALNAAKVFDVGSYTVVLAENTNQIQSALEKVPENKRPMISDDFLEGYDKLYPNQPIAVCCWDGIIEAEPLLWWYVPSRKDTLFFPTMDAHDGKAPNVKARVTMDHMLSVGSSLSDRVGHYHLVRYQDKIPNSVRSLLPSYVYGTKLQGTVHNGDMFVRTDNLCAGSKDYKNVPRAHRFAASMVGTEITGTSSQFQFHGWS